MSAMNRIFAGLLAFCFAVSGMAANKNVPDKAFQREMFSPQVLGAFGVDRQQLAALNQKQRADLLAAHRSLMRFLVAAQSHTPDVRRFVHPALLASFRDETSFLQKLFGQETDVLSAAVTDFKMNSDEEIEIRYYVVLFAEGRLLLREDKSLLRRTNNNWMITRIGGLP